jgi:hypothetical protein
LCETKGPIQSNDNDYGAGSEDTLVSRSIITARFHVSILVWEQQDDVVIGQVRAIANDDDVECDGWTAKNIPLKGR